jgi:hypothetical protein
LFFQLLSTKEGLRVEKKGKKNRKVKKIAKKNKIANAKN